MHKKGMNKPEEMFYEFGIRVFKSWGLDTLSAKLVCLLYIHNDKIAISDLAKHTGYSLASISNKLKKVETAGIIEKTKVPGSKKIYYFMENNIFKIFEKKMEISHRVEINPAKENIPFIIESYKGLKLTKEEKARKSIIENYYKQIVEFDDFYADVKNLLAKRNRNYKKYEKDK